MGLPSPEEGHIAQGHYQEEEPSAPSTIFISCSNIDRSQEPRGFGYDAGTINSAHTQPHRRLASSMNSAEHSACLHFIPSPTLNSRKAPASIIPDSAAMSKAEDQTSHNRAGGTMYFRAEVKLPLGCTYTHQQLLFFRVCRNTSAIEPAGFRKEADVWRIIRIFLSGSTLWDTFSHDILTVMPDDWHDMAGVRERK